jgi:hypothetical protein
MKKTVDEHGQRQHLSFAGFCEWSFEPFYQKDKGKGKDKHKGKDKERQGRGEHEQPLILTDERCIADKRRKPSV